MLACNDLFNGDLNPKVQIELERLNTASAQINEFENKLQDVRNTFIETMSKRSSHLTEISHRVGSAIPRARPYFELKRAQNEIQRESQMAAMRYDTACIELNHANSVVTKSELVAKESLQLDDSGMEILNIAIAKVNMAKKEKNEAHREHQKYLATYIELEEKIQLQKKRHKNDIKKSMEYFHYSKCMDEKLKEDKQKIESYEEKVRICKAIYNESLQRLEDISNSIHEQRKMKELLGPRGEGVGAEIAEESCNGEETDFCSENFDSKRESSHSDQTETTENESSLSITSTTFSNVPCRPVKRRSTLASSTPIINDLLRVASDYHPHFLSNNDNKQIFRTLPRDISLSVKMLSKYPGNVCNR